MIPIPTWGNFNTTTMLFGVLYFYRKLQMMSQMNMTLNPCWSSSKSFSRLSVTLGTLNIATIITCYLYLELPHCRDATINHNDTLLFPILVLLCHPANTTKSTNTKYCEAVRYRASCRVPTPLAKSNSSTFQAFSNFSSPLQLWKITVTVLETTSNYVLCQKATILWQINRKHNKVSCFNVSPVK